METHRSASRWVWVVPAVLMLAIGYPLSFGPACWVCSYSAESSGLWEVMDFVYSPILRGWWHSDPGTISKIIAWYANLWADGTLTVARMLDGSFCLIPTMSV